MVNGVKRRKGLGVRGEGGRQGAPRRRALRAPHSGALRVKGRGERRGEKRGELRGERPHVRPHQQRAAGT
jgi:hypothetical protein